MGNEGLGKDQISGSGAVLMAATIYFDFEDDINFSYGLFKAIEVDSEVDLDMIVGTPIIWYRFGSIFKLRFINSPFFIQKSHFSSIQEVNNVAKEGLDTINWLFTFLWFIKDHSCNTFGMGYFMQDQKRQC